VFATPALAVAALLIAQPPAAPKFEIKDGDRIVWIGNTLIEREQRYGYWETALHAAFPKVNFTLRNLGWSGDTVFGEARAAFDPPSKGYERLVSLTLELKPTVIFVSYGTNESFEGEAGLPKFVKGLEKLLDALKPANARIVLFTPIRFGKSPSLTDPKPRNTMLSGYDAVIRKVGTARGLTIAELGVENLCIADALTDNGIHLNEQGYKDLATGFLGSLGANPFAATDSRTLEPLRKAIVEKNQLFFYKWRPQNDTYLFGFRKHEQGKNAKEIVEFDPLVAAVEAEIETLRKSLIK